MWKFIFEIWPVDNATIECTFCSFEQRQPFNCGEEREKKTKPATRHILSRRVQPFEADHFNYFAMKILKFLNGAVDEVEYEEKNKTKRKVKWTKANKIFGFVWKKCSGWAKKCEHNFTQPMEIKGDSVYFLNRKENWSVAKKKKKKNELKTKANLWAEKKCNEFTAKARTKKKTELRLKFKFISIFVLGELFMWQCKQKKNGSTHLPLSSKRKFVCVLFTKAGTNLSALSHKKLKLSLMSNKTVSIKTVSFNEIFWPNQKNCLC